ncbi:MAG TPA: GTPase ObgE [Bacilli bacterium]|nr:GTPase ObgE [Bacilli bacterium]
MFVDEVKILVKAGSGGDGCSAFRREKCVPDGGPSGGNGGNGGNIIFKVDLGLKTLLDLRYQKEIKAPKGVNGSGSNKTGKNGEDVIIKVPQGTTIKDLDTNLIIADLIHKDDEVLIARGGVGGRGNAAFATNRNTAPTLSENGEPGEVKELLVELRLLADVGLVGMPSVGKSTLLSKISASKPKIAEYHFTTLSPNLGVVKTKSNRVFVVADLPGLIEGASKGEGLGDKFLKHIERTKVVAHIIDISGSEGRDPYSDYILINNELKNFSEKLANKKQVVLANKIDVEGAKEKLKEFISKVNVPIYEMSAINSYNIDLVLEKLADMLDKENEEPLFDESKFESHILYKFEKEKPFIIEKINNDTYNIKGKEIEKIFKMTKFSNDEAVKRFANKLRKLGIDEELKKLGAKENDSVRILGYEFEYKE